MDRSSSGLSDPLWLDNLHCAYSRTPHSMVWGCACERFMHLLERVREFACMADRPTDQQKQKPITLPKVEDGVKLFAILLFELLQLTPFPALWCTPRSDSCWFIEMAQPGRNESSSNSSLVRYMRRLVIGSLHRPESADCAIHKGDKPEIQRLLLSVLI